MRQWCSIFFFARPASSQVMGLGCGGTQWDHPLGRVVKKGPVLKPPNILIGISSLHQLSYISVRQQSTLFLGRSALFSRTERQFFLYHFSPCLLPLIQMMCKCILCILESTSHSRSIYLAENSMKPLDVHVLFCTQSCSFSARRIGSPFLAQVINFWVFLNFF